LPSSSAPEYTQTWYENVLRNAAINKSTFYIDKPGKHTLHIKCGDPGMVIQKIVLDFGGMKKSYTGPVVSKVE
jgi:S-adenosylmethionine synthetase